MTVPHRTPRTPSRLLIPLAELLDTDDIGDDVDVRAVGVAVVLEAAAGRWALAGAAHVSAFHDVAEALEGYWLSSLIAMKVNLANVAFVLLFL